MTQPRLMYGIYGHVSVMAFGIGGSKWLMDSQRINLQWPLAKVIRLGSPLEHLQLSCTNRKCHLHS